MVVCAGGRINGIGRVLGIGLKACSLFDAGRRQLRTRALRGLLMLPVPIPTCWPALGAPVTPKGP